MFAKDGEIFDPHNATHIALVLLFYVRQDGDLDEGLLYYLWHFFYDF